MLASKEKLEDMKWRGEMLELMEYTLRRYQETKDEALHLLAQEMGEASRRVKEFIDGGDYAERDRKRAAFDRILKKVENLGCFTNETVVG